MKKAPVTRGFFMHACYFFYDPSIPLSTILLQ